jgi:nucleoside-diphosphate-sugar epimerase
MKVLMTGCTGHAGRNALEHFVNHGHEVHALVRPHHISNLKERENVKWIAGDFSDSEIISDSAYNCDAVVHIGASHDEHMESLDTNFISSVTEAFDKTGKVFITTSASVVYNDTKGVPRDESEPIEDPHPLRAWRARHDLEVVGLSSRGIRGASVRPGLIYGNAGGWLTGLIFRARETGKSLHIGEGTNLVSSVHVNALSDLYLKIVTNDSAQGIYNAASDEVTCSKDYATLIADYFGPNIEVVCWPLEEAREAMGELADLSCIECIITSERARSELGWLPIAPSVATELSIGSYRTDELIPYSH